MNQITNKPQLTNTDKAKCQQTKAKQKTNTEHAEENKSGTDKTFIIVMIIIAVVIVVLLSTIGLVGIICFIGIAASTLKSLTK